MQFIRSAELASIVVLALAPVAVAQSPVEADKHSCAELGKLVDDAGELQLNAQTHNPNGSEGYSLNTFISRRTRCPFANERPSRWRVYTANNEICEDLYICLPRPSDR